ncbi:MAG: YciI family protein [Acidocella sp.]|nr:YciI family protein [Acidocella sp.]
MKFVLIAHDKPGAQALRQQTRPAHLAYWQAIIGAELVFGGPLLGADGAPFGSILVVETEDEAHARALFEADPYVTADLFELTTLSPFRLVFERGALVA